MLGWDHFVLSLFVSFGWSAISSSRATAALGRGAMGSVVQFQWWCTGLFFFWLPPFFCWRPNWISRSQFRETWELTLNHFNLSPCPAWGLLRVPQLWAKVEAILWVHLLLPRSFMRYGLLVATAKSLPGRASCALSAHTDEHAKGDCVMAWLSTEGSGSWNP